METKQRAFQGGKKEKKQVEGRKKGVGRKEGRRDTRGRGGGKCGKRGMERKSLAIKRGEERETRRNKYKKEGRRDTLTGREEENLHERKR